MSSIYDFVIQKLDSEEQLYFKDFKGKYLMLVNVASRCGFTYQYQALQQLYEQRKDHLTIVGLPCNQFLFQESGSESKIASFCQLKYGVTFPVTTKIKVKGSNQHPIYQWLTQNQFNGVGDFKVSWNFNKFLVDPHGTLLGHFGSKIEPNDPQIVSFMD